MKRCKEGAISVIFGSAVSHGILRGSMTCFSAYLFPRHSLQRGSNALLIYHSSVLAVWSSSDDPHLAPTAILYSPTPWVCLLVLLFLTLLFLFLSQYLSLFVSVSLSLILFHSLFLQLWLYFYFLPILLVRSSIWVRFRWWHCFPFNNSRASELLTVFLYCPPSFHAASQPF